MAYDLLLRKQTRHNWSGAATRARLPAGRSSSPSTSSRPSPSDRRRRRAELLAHLAVLKLKVDAGDKKALKEWRSSMKKVLDAKKRADRGDPVAQHLVKVLNESGLFAGVQRMEV